MIKAIDFFCGAGGLSRGLLDAGIRVLAGVDNDKRLQQTYENNNAPSKFLYRNIKTIDIRQLRHDLGIVSTDLVLYAACTPCQPFSSLTRLNGEDKRKNLLLAFARLVDEMPPDFIFVENVPGLSNQYGRSIYEQFTSVLDRKGFIYRASLLDAKDYGVPQVRKRFILLASRHGNLSFPRRSKNRPTVSSAIKKFPRITDGGNSQLYFNHEARVLAPHLKKIVSCVPKNGGSRRDIKDSSILLKCHRKKPDVHKDVFGRMRWDSQASDSTIMRSCCKKTHSIYNF